MKKKKLILKYLILNYYLLTISDTKITNIYLIRLLTTQNISSLLGNAYSADWTPWLRLRESLVEFLISCVFKASNKIGLQIFCFPNLCSLPKLPSLAESNTLYFTKWTFDMPVWILCGWYMFQKFKNYPSATYIFAMKEEHIG